MAITVTASQSATAGWIVNGNSADASGCEELKAAPGAGVSLYLERLFISSGAAIHVTVGSGESNSAVEAVIVGPLYFAANTNSGPIVFDPPVKLAANKSLTVDASGAGNVTVIAQGFTQ